jgi:hypothetical protein
VLPVAHIGNVPVEEWLPFAVPLVALYLYGRHRARRRRANVAQLPGIEALDQATIERVLDKWSHSRHAGVSRDCVALMYPPGPEGTTVAELAQRVRADQAAVRARLEDLADLGYLELEVREGENEARAWLTSAGYDLQELTEAALLAGPPGGPSQPQTGLQGSQKNLREFVP